MKGSQEVFETVSNQSEILSIFPSVYLFVSLSLSLSTFYLSIILSQSLRCGSSAARSLNSYHVATILVKCCIGSLSDPFPLGLDKQINGMRRSLTTPNLSQKPPLCKIMICGPTNQNHAKNSLSVKSGSWVPLNWS